MYYTQEQIDRANQADLVSFLQSQVEDIRQNCNPRGSASTFCKIEDPVVVKPETVSNQAFITLNSPPQIR